MWNFVSPRIVFGEDALSSLKEISGKRALIITDKTLVELGIVERVSRELIKAGLDLQVFDERARPQTKKRYDRKGMSPPDVRIVSNGDREKIENSWNDEAEAIRRSHTRDLPPSQQTEKTR